MSTPIKNQQSRESYPTDLTDKQWNLIRPLLPKSKSNQQTGGRPRTTDLREIVNACLYQARAGGAWRMLPHDFPRWKQVFNYFDAWKKDGTWQKIHDTLYHKVRLKAGKNSKPSAGVIDAQSVQTTKKGVFAALLRVKR